MTEQITFFNISPGSWASSCSTSQFKWYASTNFFSPKLFTMNDYATSCNSQITDNGNSLEGFWKILKPQLSGTVDLNNQNVIVLDTDLLVNNEALIEMNARLKEYFCSDISVMRVNGNSIGFAKDVISNSVVIAPFIYGDPKSFAILNQISPYLKNSCSAKSVIAIFACYVVKDDRGNSPVKEEYPYISQNSFAIEISFESFRSIMDLIGNAPPMEKFQRKSKPINLSGTTWVSSDGMHELSFDSMSINGASYNGDFTIYSYDSTNKTLYLHIEDNFGLIRDMTLNVLSLTSDIMELDGELGHIILKKKK